MRFTDSSVIAPSDLASLAARFHRFGALAQAEVLYREALQHQLDDAELWARLGRVYHALGHHDEAIDSFRRTLGLRPGQIESQGHFPPIAFAGNRGVQRSEEAGAIVRLAEHYPVTHLQAFARPHEGGPTGSREPPVQKSLHLDDI